MNRRGFTVVELIIVITIMAALMTLGVVNLRGSQANARDAERKTDIESIAQQLETYYKSGTVSPTTPPDKCTGGIITHVGEYTIHTFNSGSSNLVCTSNVTANVLLVGGGGGGGPYVGGGGGGGGFYEGSPSLAAGASYAVSVGSGGSGGSGGASGPADNTSGGNSSIVGSGVSLTALGGGTGNRYPDTTGTAGGSGGGAGGCQGGGGLGGAAQQPSSLSGGYGYRGGNMSGVRSGNDTEGRGGGGAGSAGSDNSCAEPGDGGNGRQSTITGTIYYYGGGGGGGAFYGGDLGATRAGNGGLGGGGGGGAFTTGTVGTGGTGGTAVGETPTLNMGTLGQGVGGAGGTNTGGGGGGCGHQDKGGVGGSGIVIVRYLTAANAGTYPSTALTTNVTILSVRVFLPDMDTNSITAPGTTNPATTFISATNNTQTTAGVLPQPTTNQYVYQPLHRDGTLCNDTAECTKFNLYYKSEADNTVYIVTSKNQ